MKVKKIHFKNVRQLQQHIQSHVPTLYISSQTSTVIPYDQLQHYSSQNLVLGDLSSLPPQISMVADDVVQIEGAVNWDDLSGYLKPLGKRVMVSPTEHSALVLAGLATSATGEHSFGYGSLREGVVRCQFLDSEGREQELDAARALQLEGLDLKAYQQAYLPFLNFKNAPFPRLQQQTDLMVGTEGQLGVLISAQIKVCEDEAVEHLYLRLPSWLQDFSAHCEVVEKVQAYRGKILTCELLDDSSLNLLKDRGSLKTGCDGIFLEVKASAFEEIYENVLCQLDCITEEDIFQIPSAQFHHYRVEVPRAINDKISSRHLVKKGTDTQVARPQLPQLLAHYKKWKQQYPESLLFGHLGDCHLHFNFLPTADQVDEIQQHLDSFYQEISQWTASPFAEHGIGLLKKPFMRYFYTETQLNLFRKLKAIYDPHGQFFPQGYMTP